MRLSRLPSLTASLLILSLAACGGRVGLSDVGVAEEPPPPPPTAEPGALGLPGTQVVWEWEEDARPMALAVGDERLGVIVSDGRFFWLDPATGHSIVGGFVWPDEIRGESWGSVTIGGDVALVKVVETFQSELGDFPETRSRVLAFDADGAELWTLPELGDKHIYSATIGQGMALIGTHRGFTDNSLSAYDLASGEIEWRYEAEQFGFERLVADQERVYSALVDADGGGVAAYDVDSGAILWANHDDAVHLSDDVLLDGGRFYVLTQPGAVALDPGDGEVAWALDVGLAPEAGMVARDPYLYVVPAPTAGLGNRPGLLGVSTEDGSVLWHALAGLLADPLAASGEALWAVVRDPDAATVSLSVLEADSGLERARLPLGGSYEEHYQLVADGDTVYVLSNTLRAYTIPRE